MTSKDVISLVGDIGLVGSVVVWKAWRTLQDRSRLGADGFEGGSETQIVATIVVLVASGCRTLAGRTVGRLPERCGTNNIRRRSLWQRHCGATQLAANCGGWVSLA